MQRFEVERMTPRSDAFFADKSFLPKERYCTVVTLNGNITAGHCYYKDEKTGVWGVYFKLANRSNKNWCDDKALAECIRFPFEYLGARLISSTFTSPLVRYYIERIGAKVYSLGDGRYVGHVTAEDGLAAAKKLEAENVE